MDKEKDFEKLVDSYVEDSANFIIIKALQILHESKDFSTRLQALELLRKMR